jgi:hypothetical protein
MSRQLRFAMLLGCMLLVTKGAFGKTYYVAANGADTNNGTAFATPWLHAPGMVNCSNLCASTSINPGDSIILRGGDTWHSSAPGQTSTPIGLPWTLTATGSSGAQLYVGVDNTTANASGAGTTGWYNTSVCGGSWCRPKLNDDNPLSTTPVASCTYQTNPNVLMVMANPHSYVTLDNIEFLGFCWQDIPANNPTEGVLGDQAIGLGDIISNNYFHGWTHKAFNCTQSPSCTCVSVDDGVGNINTSSQTGGNIVLAGNVIDGADSVLGTSAIVFGAYDMHNNIIRYTNGGVVVELPHITHDNLIELNTQTASCAHSNGIEFNSEYNSENYFYNNVVRNNGVGINVQLNPFKTTYYFNNICYGNQQVCFGIPQAPNWDGGLVSAFNNSDSDGGGYLGLPNCAVTGATVYANNLFINTAFCGANTGGVSWTNASATSAGYTLTTTYALAPQTNNCNGTTPCGVGTGSNMTSTCNSFADSTAKAACLQDTTFAVKYDSASNVAVYPARTTIPRPSGNWDAGAFQFNSNQQVVLPPVLKSATPH